jgi:hypothetical protein
MSYIFFVALLVGATAQFFYHRILISCLFPVLLYVACSTFIEFLIPHHGGGASFWPIDILFAGPLAGVGGVCGALLTIKYLKSKK